MSLTTSRSVLVVLSLLAGSLWSQSPPIRQGWVLLDDEIVPQEALAGDATWLATAWPAGVVPYDFDASVSASNRANVADAIADVAAATNVTFVLRTTQADWIRFYSSTGNNSYIGRIGGLQPINIVSWTSRFIIVHEVCHALGFWHEQQRPDRDSYVTISWSNIQGAYSGNFTTVAGATTTGAYDFDSLMHYDACSFSIDCPPGTTCNCTNHVIDVLPQYAAWQSSLGQRVHLSLGDAAGLAAHYGAPPAPTISAITPSIGTPGGLPITIDGTRFCKGSLDGQGLTGSSVRFDGVALSTTYVSPTQLLAQVSAGLATVGTHTVNVLNASPGGGLSLGFNYQVGVPTADFLASPTAGATPAVVSFTDLSSPGVTGWAWDFGDGFTASSQNPSHTYYCAGAYTVSLTATWPGTSDNETKTGYVVVSQGVSTPNFDLSLEFNQTGLLPTASHGFVFTSSQGANPASVASVSCGVLQWRELTALGQGSFGMGFDKGAWSGPPLPISSAFPTILEARLKPISVPVLPGGIYLEASDNLHHYVVSIQSNSIKVAWADTTTPVSYALPGPSVGAYHVVQVVGRPGDAGSATVEVYWDGVSIGPPLPAGPNLVNGGVIGFGDGSSYADSFDADIDYIRVKNGPLCQGVGQPNSDLARLEINGTGHGSDAGPILLGGLSGTVVTATLSGPPNAPYILGIGPANPANLNLGCSGLLDIGTPPYADVVFLLDGLAAPWAFSLDPCGLAQFSTALPALPTGTPLANAQAVIFQPSGCSMVLTAAFYLTY